MLLQLFHLGLCAILCMVATHAVSIPAAAILLLWMPGRNIVRLLSPMNRHPGRSLWLPLAISFTVMPVLLWPLWHWSNSRGAVLGGVLAVDLVLIVAAGLFGQRDEPTSPILPEKSDRRLLTAILVWVAACTACFYWIPVAAQRTPANPSNDYIKHHAITWSLAEHPLPLRSAFYAAEPGESYHYYDGFYLVPAALRIMTGGKARIAVVFGAAAGLNAAAFVAMTALLARGLLHRSRAMLMAAACACVIGGWDVIAVGARALAGGPLTAVLDAWCPAAWRIHNLLDNMLWCPQHVCAVLVLLTVAYLLQQAPSRGWWLVMGPLAVLSLLGARIYQAMVILPAAGVDVLPRLLSAPRPGRTQDWRLWGLVVSAGALTLVLALPRLSGYLEMAGRHEGGLTLAWPRFPLAFFGRYASPGPLANWLDGPWMLLVDFGVGAVAALLVGRTGWGRLWRDPGLRLVSLAGLLGLALMWTIRSDINRIDYGFRLAAMPAMIIAAALVGLVAEGTSVRRLPRGLVQAVLYAGLILGLPVGLYEAPLLAGRTLLEKDQEAADSGAFTWLRLNTPHDAVVQGHPFRRTYLPQKTDRAMGVLDPRDPHVSVLRPRDFQKMEDAAEWTAGAYAAPPRMAALMLARAGATHVLVGGLEQELLGTLNPFEDSSRFQKVYDDGHARVYRLLPAITSQPAPGTSP